MEDKLGLQILSNFLFPSSFHSYSLAVLKGAVPLQLRFSQIFSSHSLPPSTGKSSVPGVASIYHFGPELSRHPHLFPGKRAPL